MRSKNTSNYEEQNRNFRYTLLAVLGVLLVVAVLAYAMRAVREGNVPGTQDPLNIGSMEQSPGTVKDPLQSEEEVNVSQRVPVEQIPSVDSRSTTGGSAVEKESKFLIPVEGASVQKEYSAENPIYSKTLEQYQLHYGVDYAAPADSQVRAVEEGTVVAVYKDDKLGVTIEIDHGNGLITKYSNLSVTGMVEEGDVVTRGQVISGVGNSALFEILDPEHLHFEVWKDGNSVDPAEYF